MTKKPTDREKLIDVFYVFSVYERESKQCIWAGGRRFYFDDLGCIEKIIEYDENGEAVR